MAIETTKTMTLLFYCCIMAGMVFVSCEVPGGTDGAPDAILDQDQAEILKKIADMTGKSIPEISEASSQDDGMIYVCELRPNITKASADEVEDSADGGRFLGLPNLPSMEELKAMAKAQMCKVQCTTAAADAGLSCKQSISVCMTKVSGATDICKDCPETLCYLPNINNVVAPICKWNKPLGLCGMLPGDASSKCEKVCDTCSA